MKIKRIEICDVKGFGRVFYSDNSSLIVSIPEAKKLSDRYKIIISKFSVI